MVWQQSIMKRNLIKIEVYGGCVTEVTGLPEGWESHVSSSTGETYYFCPATRAS